MYLHSASPFNAKVTCYIYNFFQYWEMTEDDRRTISRYKRIEEDLSGQMQDVALTPRVLGAAAQQRLNFSDQSTDVTDTILSAAQNVQDFQQYQLRNLPSTER